MFGTGYAWAMGGAPSGGSSPAGGLVSLAPLLLMFVIFYVLLIRPQQKQARKHQEFLKALKVGDRVITSGGIYGQVTGLAENAVTIEIADKVRVKVTRTSILSSAQDGAAADGKISPTGKES